ncbi:hypothetical protein V2J09_017603 [Rumex salicifolius]
MDDGEVDVSNQEVFSNSMGDIPCSGSMDSFFDELLNDTHACTHTHTCNPPGPDLSHTHTCFHVHTKIVSAPSDDNGGNGDGNDNSAESVEKKTKKRPLGNREAVRKYREKKKARAASLEDEVVKLRALNQQLLKRLQAQAALEAEVARLKCLLVDIRGRIEGEIGSFPYQKTIKSGDSFQNVAIPGSLIMNPCNVQCADQSYCLYPDPGIQGKNIEASLNVQGLNGCDFDNLNCMGTGSRECLGYGPCDMGNMAPTVNSSGESKRKVMDFLFVEQISYPFRLQRHNNCYFRTKGVIGSSVKATQRKVGDDTWKSHNCTHIKVKIHISFGMKAQSNTELSTYSQVE